MRTPNHSLLLATCLVGFLISKTVHAFMPNPDLLTIYPAVARAGSTVEVSVKGTDLDELESLRFSGGKITSEPVTRAPDEFQPEPARFSTTFRVTIPVDVSPGVYEVRSLGYFGLSTARPFLVLPANSSEAVIQENCSSQEKAIEIAAGDGVINLLPSGGFQWYRFDARKDQRILANVWAERLDSRADVLLTILDEAGRELESSRLHFGRDPFVDFVAPADGTYFVTLSDALFGGGRDYFYRLSLSIDPHIDFVFPPAGEPGTSPPFTFFGRNLPGGSLGADWKLGGKLLETVSKTIAVPETPRVPARFDPGLPRQGMLEGFYAGLPGSNEIKIGFATAPVVLEKDGNSLQELTLPTEVAGRFDKPGDFDQFRIRAEKGKTYWIEAISHRLGSIADPVIIVERIETGDDGKETFTPVVENDDPPSFFGKDFLDDLNADSLDPELSFTPEADGDYRITLLNQSAGGSIAHLYRLAIREAAPSFQLIVGTELTKTINNDAYPNAPLVRRGGSMVYRVLAFRRDGFDGEIKVTIDGLPEGVTAEPLFLCGDSTEGFLTVHAAENAPRWHGTVEIRGESMVGDTKVTRIARTASILWGKRVFGRASQVRSRLDLETVLSVMDAETEPTRLLPSGDSIFEVAMNDTLELSFKTVENGNRVGNLQVEVHGFPGLHRSPPKVSVKEGDTEATLSIPMKKTGNFEIKPGKYQFVLQGVGNATYSRNPAAVERSQGELERLKGLAVKLAQEEKAASSAVASAENDLAKARKNETSAGTDDEIKKRTEEIARLEKALEQAQAELKNGQNRSDQLKKVIDRVTKEVASAVNTAKPKSNQFATYSMPLTVIVTEEKK